MMLQKELRSAIEQRDGAIAKLHTVLAAVQDSAARAQVAEAECLAAEAALEDVGGNLIVDGGSDAPVIAAQERFDAAERAYKAAAAMARGATKRLPALNTEVERAAERVAHVATRIAVIVAHDVEKESLALAAKLGRLLAHRQQLARFAQRHSDTDPLGANNEWSPFRRNLLAALGEQVPGSPLQPVEVAPVTVESLLLSTPVATDEAMAAE